MKILKEAQRKTFERTADLTEAVGAIIGEVRQKGDAAVLDLGERFDGIRPQSLRVSAEVVKAAYEKVEADTVEAIRMAAEQIRLFAEKQRECLLPLETSGGVAGVTLGHRLVPVDACGAYVPGGRYPLPSTALMLAIPAKVAGVKRVAACSPASRTHGGIAPVVLVAMDIAGVDEIYCMGGAQAVAALAYGTNSVPRVDMIVGPGNKYVTEAKRQVLGEVGIDSLAGPSEVLIIADESARADFIATDILAQCEHDPNARATLLTDSQALADAVQTSLDAFAMKLPTGATALQAWQDNGVMALVDDMDEAVAISNRIAPEHVQVQTKQSRAVADKLTHYGSLFIGEYAPVAFGDYCSGTNHTLPTMGTARFSSGVWVGTFLKTAFYQHITQQGCRNLSETCMRLAETEGLLAHRLSVSVRLGKD